MMPRALRMLALPPLLLLSACSTPIPMPPMTASLDEQLTALATKHRICAVAVATIKNRTPGAINHASGCAGKSKPTSAGIFQAASLGKPVFAYAVLKLAEQGKLDLDAPVMNYLPNGYRHQFNQQAEEPSELVTDAQLQRVTPRMILNHTSGLPNWASGPLKFEAPPGTKWSYSGEGFVLLQRAVEALTGQALDGLMAEQVFRPLAMHRSSYVWNAQVGAHLVPGTKANGAARTVMQLNKAVAAYTLHTTAEDYGKFLAAVLKDANLLKQITASPVSVDPSSNVQWGLGWGVERSRQDTYIWHWGNNTGYRAFAMASLRTGDGFVMLTNSENGLQLAEPVAQRILPDEHKAFRFAALDDDVLNVLCKSIRLCL